MNVRETENNNTAILALEGRLDSTTSEAFEQQLMGKIDAGSNKMVIDLSSLDYISSAGLRVLLMAAKRLKTEGGAFALCRLKEPIRQVFEISGFLSILTVVDSIDDAIAAIAS